MNLNGMEGCDLLLQLNLIGVPDKTSRTLWYILEPVLEHFYHLSEASCAGPVLLAFVTQHGLCGE